MSTLTEVLYRMTHQHLPTPLRYENDHHSTLAAKEGYSEPWTVWTLCFKAHLGSTSKPLKDFIRLCQN